MLPLNYSYYQEFNNGHWYPAIPESALPSKSAPSYTTINPKAKYTGGKGLNIREEQNFCGICEGGTLQLVSCYRDLDEDMCSEDFRIRCDGCPYFVWSKRWFYDTRDLNVMKPFFLLKWMKENEYEYDGTDKKAKWHVYFISDTHYVKIGKSNRNTDRLSTLQTGNPNPLTILFVVDVKDERSAYSVEHFLHNAFRDYKKEGEWYDILDKLQLRLWQEHYKED